MERILLQNKKHFDESLSKDLENFESYAKILNMSGFTNKSTRIL